MVQNLSPKIVDLDYHTMTLLEGSHHKIVIKVWSFNKFTNSKVILLCYDVEYLITISSDH